MKHVSRGVRLQQVVSLIKEHPGITTYKLAQELKLTNSGYFRDIVRQLYDAGLIMARVEPCNNPTINRYSWYPMSIEELDGDAEA